MTMEQRKSPLAELFADLVQDFVNERATVCEPQSV